MRRYTDSGWVDPAPLEVERPRLPWWTMLPRKLLAAVSPLIAIVVLIGLGVFLARRVWRYPLCVIGGAVLEPVGK
jgi:S-DNA-T family DNA segregation ATPase FtsK/SpoIIIE